MATPGFWIFSDGNLPKVGFSLCRLPRHREHPCGAAAEAGTPANSLTDFWPRQALEAGHVELCACTPGQREPRQLLLAVRGAGAWLPPTPFVPRQLRADTGGSSLCVSAATAQRGRAGLEVLIRQLGGLIHPQTRLFAPYNGALPKAGCDAQI